MFIVGLFRSGTTFLHHIIFTDSKQFSSFRTWEMYLAPSITQRKIIRMIQFLDRQIGSPLMRFAHHFDKHHLGRVKFHHVGLWREEEDEGLLLYLWDSIFTWFFFLDSKGIEPYLFAGVPRERRVKRLRFYRACVQRHLYCYPKIPFHLSKSPAFTPQLDALKKVFPDARIVYMYRKPLDVLVSQATWFSFCWHYFGSPKENYPFKEEMLKMTRHWYRQPMALFNTWEKNDYLIVRYDNLINHPVNTVKKIYEHFGIALRQEFLTRLKQEIAIQKDFGSAGNVTLDDVGYNKDYVHKYLDIPAPD